MNIHPAIHGGVATNNSPATTVGTAPAAGEEKREQPHLKVSQLGLTWNHLRASNAQKKLQLSSFDGDEKTSSENEQKTFTEQELELKWLSMCNRMPQQLSGIAARMKNITPHIKEMPAVEVVVPNEIVKAEMETIKGSIVKTLQRDLYNNAITMDIRVAERQELEKALTRREQFEEMSQQNPSVERLKVLFDLELA